VAVRGLEVRDPERAAWVLRSAAPAGESWPVSAVPARRAEFLAGRWCAVRALADVGGRGPVGRDADGAPTWPAGHAGSISHCHGRVLAVAARAADAAGLGVDVARWVRAAVAEELGTRVLAPGEHDVLAAAVGGAAAFTAGFSAKEALYKALHPTARQFMDFDAARVVAAGARTLTLELTCDWAPDLPAGRRFGAWYACTAHGVETLVVLEPGAGR
jgi:enterobactin synthetase component D